MGILLEALCGLVDADKLEQLLRAVICLFLLLPVCRRITSVI